MKLKLLDIDNLLGEEERIPCEFESSGYDMGHLDMTLNQVHLPEKSKVSLPLWLVRGLVEKNIVRMEIPKHFQKRMREEIKAGPEAIKLRDFSFYFFEVGLIVARVSQDLDLLRTLRQAMSADRFKTLAVRTLFRYV